MDPETNVKQEMDEAWFTDNRNIKLENDNIDPQIKQEMDTTTMAAVGGVMGDGKRGLEDPAASVSPNKKSNTGVGGYWCEICKMNLKNDEISISHHNSGAKHVKKAAAQEMLMRLSQDYDCFEQDPESGILRCILCNIVATSPPLLEAHFNGSKHKSKVDGASNGTANARDNETAGITTDGYWCEICRLSGTHTPMSVAAHVNGAKHLRKVAGHELLTRLKESTDCFDHDEATGLLKCRVCNIEVNTPQLLDVHLNGTKHKNKVEGKPAKRKHDGDPNYTPAKRVAPNPEDAERTVFLKNMSFKSTEDDIRAVFEDCGEIESLYCIKDFKGRNKGFGYLMFKDKDSAVRALEKDKTVLEERPMYVSAYNPEEKREHRRAEPEKDKLYVSGLPLTMTEEEIRSIFEPHGEIKDIRLLMTREQGFKGMCYLDYCDAETAAAVKEATDQIEMGPDQKITVQFSYPPRPRRHWRGGRHQYRRNRGGHGGAGAAVPPPGSLTVGEDGGANNFETHTEAVE